MANIDYPIANKNTTDQLADLISTKSDKNGIVYDATFNSAWIAGTPSIDPATGVITLDGHGLTNNTAVEFRANMGALPTGISPYDSDVVGTYYNVINVSGNTFQVTTTVGGSAPVIPSDAGTAGWQIRKCAVAVGKTDFVLSIGDELEIFATINICKNATTAETLNVYLGPMGELKYDTYYKMNSSLIANVFSITANKKYSRHILHEFIKKVSDDGYYCYGIASGSSTDDKSSYTQEADKAFSAYARGTVAGVGLVLGRNAGSGDLGNGSRIIAIRR